jgi:SSS family solute:Na+ symporter
VNKTYFQYFSVLITLVSGIVAIGVSLATQEPDYKVIGGLTYGTANDADHAETRASWDWRDVAASAVVLLAILGAYLYFRG